MTKQYGTPGPRAIYPEMCDSPSLGRCGLVANALFPRLIAQADDQGRLAGGAHAVLLQCLPRLLSTTTIDQVEAALAELEGVAMLQRYEIEGEEYVQLLQWWRWQGSQRRAYPSRWPSPRGWADLVYGTTAEGAKSLEEAAGGTSPRNAAIRSVMPRLAARATPARAGACARARARRVPCRASADAVPPAPAREGSAGGAPRGGSPSRFADLVPPPPGHRAPA